MAASFWITLTHMTYDAGRSAYVVEFNQTEKQKETPKI